MCGRSVFDLPVFQKISIRNQNKNGILTVNVTVVTVAHRVRALAANSCKQSGDSSISQQSGKRTSVVNSASDTFHNMWQKPSFRFSQQAGRTTSVPRDLCPD